LSITAEVWQWKNIKLKAIREKFLGIEVLAGKECLVVGRENIFVDVEVELDTGEYKSQS